MTLTGQLGDVMQESAKTAIGYIRSTSELNISEDFFENNEVHIHLPAGATPKDGHLLESHCDSTCFTNH